MSLDAILAAIGASGEAEVTRLRADTEARIRRILAEAEGTALAQREAARRAALLPAAGERARRLHHAKLEALRTVGEVRDHLAETALAEARVRFAGLRADPDYPLVLRRLTEEAINVLGDEGAQDSQCRLEADPRDEALLSRILDDLGLNLAVTPSLNCWGGLVARSGDGRIVVTNTLEVRLERATPFVRRDLALLFEKELEKTNQLQPLPERKEIILIP